jgi:hypothetical protein
MWAQAGEEVIYWHILPRAGIGSPAYGCLQAPTAGHRETRTRLDERAILSTNEHIGIQHTALSTTRTECEERPPSLYSMAL